MPPMPEPTAETGKTARIVVIGAGIAGIAAVESLRDAASSAKITLISRETELPYYRLNLTRYLAGEIKRENLPIHPARWYAERNIELLLGEEVDRLDLQDHVVVLRSGKRLPFDKLLLAAGANPFIPPIPGSDRDGGHESADGRGCGLSCWKRARRGLAASVSAEGFWAWRPPGRWPQRGAKVTLLEGHGWLLPRQLNQRAGEILGEHVGRIGITLRNNAVTREILGKERVHGVLLEDGSTIPADLVVIATGIRANSSLAQQAGLEIKHGVVVNDRPHDLASGYLGRRRRGRAQGCRVRSLDRLPSPRNDCRPESGRSLCRIRRPAPIQYAESARLGSVQHRSDHAGRRLTSQVLDQENGRPIHPLRVRRESPGGRDLAGRHETHVRHEEGGRRRTRLLDVSCSRSPTVEAAIEYFSGGMAPSKPGSRPARRAPGSSQFARDRPCHGARGHGFLRVRRVRLRVRREQGGAEVE